MGSIESLGSGPGYVSRGVSRSRPSRAEKKLGAFGLILVLGATGFAHAGYRVAPGENLTRIAASRGVSVRALAAANGIRNLNIIRVGSLLRIPASKPSSREQRPGAQAPKAEFARHKVARGENLTKIASRYRTTVSNLVRINSMTNPGLLQAGRSIKVPGPAAIGPAGTITRPQRAPAPIRAMTPGVPVPAHPVNLPAKPPVRTVSAPEPAGVEDLIVLYSEKFGVDPALMKGLAWQESGWKQHVVSSAGAVGIMQVLPQTGDFVSRHLLKRPLDLRDPRQNVEAGVAFYAFYLSKTSGDERIAAAGYFQGLRSVWQNGISGRTQKYVSAVFALRNRFAAR